MVPKRAARKRCRRLGARISLWRVIGSSSLQAAVSSTSQISVRTPLRTTALRGAALACRTCAASRAPPRAPSFTRAHYCRRRHHRRHALSQAHSSMDKPGMLGGWLSDLEIPPDAKLVSICTGVDDSGAQTWTIQFRAPAPPTNPFDDLPASVGDSLPSSPSRAINAAAAAGSSGGAAPASPWSESRRSMPPPPPPGHWIPWVAMQGVSVVVGVPMNGRTVAPLLSNNVSNVDECRALCEAQQNCTMYTAAADASRCSYGFWCRLCFGRTDYKWEPTHVPGFVSARRVAVRQQPGQCDV